MAVKIPSEEMLLSTLDALEYQCADELESDVLDFKTWDTAKNALKLAKESAVCFANANGGLIVFGVDNKKTGRANSIHGCQHYDLDQLQRDIYDQTRPNLTVEISEVLVPEGKLILVRIPKGPKPPYATAQGLYQIRIGKNCCPLFPENFQRTQISIGAIDWSAQLCTGLGFESVSPIELERLRDIFRRNKPSSDWADTEASKLLEKIGAMKQGQLTCAGLLLVGRAEILKEQIPNHEVIYLAQNQNQEIQHRLDLKEPLLLLLEKLLASIQARNGSQTLETELFHMPIPDYSDTVLRESLLNAMIHRDYSAPGSIYVRQQPDFLSISNPGSFLGGITPDNLLHAEARQRNRLLAEMFQHLGLVERAGLGLDRIYRDMLLDGKPAPVYQTDSHTISLTLYGPRVDKEMALFFRERVKEGFHLKIDELLLLPYLRQHSSINLADAAQLCQRSEALMADVLESLSLQSPHPWLERRGSTYHLTRWAASLFISKAWYTLNKNIDKVQWPALIKQYVNDHGSINNKECRELLRLGDGRNAINIASAQLKQAPFLTADQSAPKLRRYHLKKD